MSRLQILSMKPKSPPPPELTVTPPQQGSRIVDTSTQRSTPTRTGSQPPAPPPPAIQIEYESELSDESVDEEEVVEARWQSRQPVLPATFLETFHQHFISTFVPRFLRK